MQNNNETNRSRIRPFVSDMTFASARIISIGRSLITESNFIDSIFQIPLTLLKRRERPFFFLLL